MTTTSLAAPAPKTSRRDVLRALSGLFLVMFVVMISSTIVSNALPAILADLDGSQTAYVWVLTAMLLTATATTPIWGKLSDLYDKKLLLQLSIIVFVIGSILSGFAWSTGSLIGFRAVQGIGMGGFQALAMTVMAALIPPRERGRYNGYLGAVMALATVSGPLVGGILVDTGWLGWRWCFFIGAPISLVSLVALQRTLHLPTIRRANVRIDYAGATLIASGVSALLVWVSFAGSSFAWMSWQTAALAGPGVAALIAAVWVERRAAEPVIPPHIVRNRTTALAIVASLAVGTAMYGSAIFLGQYFQLARGYSATASGWLTLPLMLGVFLSSTASGWLISRYGRWKPYLVAGTTLLVLGFVLLATIGLNTPLWFVGLGMGVVGVGVGMTMQNLMLAVQNTVSLREVGAASGSVTFFRSLGGTVGVTALGAILAAHVAASVRTGVAGLGLPRMRGADAQTLDLSTLSEPVLGVVQQSYADATALLFAVSAVVAVVSVIATLAIREVPLRDTVDFAPSPMQPRPSAGEKVPDSSPPPIAAVDPAPAREPALLRR